MKWWTIKIKHTFKNWFAYKYKCWAVRYVCQQLVAWIYLFICNLYLIWQLTTKSLITYYPFVILLVFMGNLQVNTNIKEKGEQTFDFFSMHVLCSFCCSFMIKIKMESFDNFSHFHFQITFCIKKLSQNFCCSHPMNNINNRKIRMVYSQIKKKKCKIFMDSSQV